MRIKKYYCRHCGQFRSYLQTYVKKTSHILLPDKFACYCKYCDREVIETELEFKKWLKLQQEEIK